MRSTRSQQNHSNKEEDKSNSKSRKTPKSSNKAKAPLSKKGYENVSAKTGNKRKKMDDESATSNKKGPASVNHLEDAAKLIDSKLDINSNLDQDIAYVRKDIDNVSESVAFKAPYVIPSCTQWFLFDSIHEIEQESLPEFFCGKYPSKTPESYKEYRNFMIKLNRENPSGYLSATTCRRHLAGDA